MQYGPLSIWMYLRPYKDSLQLSQSKHSVMVPVWGPPSPAKRSAEMLGQYQLTLPEMSLHSPAMSEGQGPRILH